MSMFKKGQSAECMEQSERENVKMWAPWGNWGPNQGSWLFSELGNH